MSGVDSTPGDGGAAATMPAQEAAADVAALRSALAEKEADLSQATMLLNDMERRFVDLQTQLSTQQNSATEHNGTVDTLRTVPLHASCCITNTLRFLYRKATF